MKRRLFLTLPAALAAQEAPITAAVRTYLAGEMAKRKIPGLTVTVANKDRVVWEEAFGVADRENGTPMKETARFRLASIAKPMTAIAVLQLVERGRLKLDADIREYVPAFSQKPHVVTVRQLLGHLGGIRHYRPGEIESTRHYSDVMTPLAIFAGDALVHPPGTKFLYTTYGYNLLGAAVQTASGMSYADYVRQNVLAPAGMKSVVIDDHFAIIEGRVRGYQKRKDGSVWNAALSDTSNKIPGGGWLGTAGDMVRLALAFRQCKLTTPETVTLMLRTQRTKTGAHVGYGMGWQIFRHLDPQVPLERRIVGHTGSQPGTNTFLGMTMDAGWSVAILTNLEGALPQTMGETVLEMLRA